MTDRSKRIEPYYPTRDEVERICAEARRMRGEFMRDTMIGAWRMLRRSVTRRKTARAPRHA